MKIRPLEAQLFRVDGWTESQAFRSEQLLLAILQTHLKLQEDNISQYNNFGLQFNYKLREM